MRGTIQKLENSHCEYFALGLYFHIIWPIKQIQNEWNISNRADNLGYTEPNDKITSWMYGSNINKQVFSYIEH